MALRKITGFHLGEHGDWVAELECGHGNTFGIDRHGKTGRGLSRQKGAPGISTAYLIARDVKRVAAQKLANQPHSKSFAKIIGYLDELAEAAAPPMASPLTTSSTRRFFCRPSAVSFDATGCVLP